MDERVKVDVRRRASVGHGETLVRELEKFLVHDCPSLVVDVPHVHGQTVTDLLFIRKDFVV